MSYRTSVNGTQINPLELLPSNSYYYRIEDGGAGIVIADSPEAAEAMVRSAYSKHGGLSESTAVDIYHIYQAPFKDFPNVLEIYEY